MQPAAAIVTLIDDNGLAVAVLVTEQFTIDGAETLTVHLLDVNIGQLTMRKTIDQCTVAVHPAFVEQFILITLADGLDIDVEALSCLGVIDTDANGLAGLAIEHPVVVLIGKNLIAIDLLDDAAGSYTCLLHIEGATLDDLINLQTVTLIAVVQEESQSGGLEVRPLGVITGAGVGTVQLTEHLA